MKKSSTFLIQLILFWGLVLQELYPLKSQTFPAGFSQTNVATGLNSPTALAIAPDGRIFICEQKGALRIVKNGTLLPSPAITLSVDSNGERGLLGLAIDPNFTTNGLIYLYYTTSLTSIHNRVSRFKLVGDIVNNDPEIVLLDLEDLSATNHNGGGLAFGPDGKLYVAVGENANSANSQSITNRLGKILRINSDGSIPPDNPATIAGIGNPTGSNRAIWAAGLRNPFTLTFQPGTGILFVNDVGQSTWEEINDCTVGGQNFGWPNTEGAFTQSSFPNFSEPIYAYLHGGGSGQGFAITGGTFFNPLSTNYPAEYKGKYFFLDFSTNFIDHLTFTNPVPLASSKFSKTTGVNAWNRASFATNISGSAVGIVTGLDGNLYYLSRNTGALVKIINSAILPIKLIAFNTKISNNKDIMLNWQTAVETNFDRFEIQKSVDFTTWEKIGEIKGAGNTSEKNSYEFIDTSPFIGNNYYRLKEIDLDEKFVFSKIINQEFENSGLKIFPNPAQTLIMVDFDNTPKTEIFIINQVGFNVNNLVHFSAKFLDISALPNGKYFIITKLKNYSFIKN